MAVENRFKFLEHLSEDFRESISGLADAVLEIDPLIKFKPHKINDFYPGVSQSASSIYEGFKFLRGKASLGHVLYGLKGIIECDCMNHLFKAPANDQETFDRMWVLFTKAVQARLAVLNACRVRRMNKKLRKFERLMQVKAIFEGC
jgi:hypothetical protein